MYQPNLKRVCVVLNLKTNNMLCKMAMHYGKSKSQLIRDLITKEAIKLKIIDES